MNLKLKWDMTTIFLFILGILVILSFFMNMDKHILYNPFPLTNMAENFSLLSDISSPVPLLWNTKTEKYNPTLNPQQLDNASTDVLLTDSYPLITTNQINFQNESKKWWHYPIFKEGSYEQVTNNIRYPNNPDIARCTPEEFCGAFYHNNQYKSNKVFPLSAVNVDTDKVRVNWWNTGDNMLPFTNNYPNVTY